MSRVRAARSIATEASHRVDRIGRDTKSARRRGAGSSSKTRQVLPPPDGGDLGTQGPHGAAHRCSWTRLSMSGALAYRLDVSEPHSDPDQGGLLHTDSLIEFRTDLHAHRGDKITVIWVNLPSRKSKAMTRGSRAAKVATRTVTGTPRPNHRMMLVEDRCRRHRVTRRPIHRMEARARRRQGHNGTPGGDLRPATAGRCPRTSASGYCASVFPGLRPARLGIHLACSTGHTSARSVKRRRGVRKRGGVCDGGGMRSATRGWMMRLRRLVEPALVVVTVAALATGGIAWLAGWRAVADWCWIAGTVTAVVPAVVWMLAALRRRTGRGGSDRGAVAGRHIARRRVRGGRVDRGDAGRWAGAGRGGRAARLP